MRFFYGMVFVVTVFLHYIMIKFNLLLISYNTFARMRPTFPCVLENYTAFSERMQLSNNYDIYNPT